MVLEIVAYIVGAGLVVALVIFLTPRHSPGVKRKLGAARLAADTEIASPLDAGRYETDDILTALVAAKNSDIAIAVYGDSTPADVGRQTALISLIEKLGERRAALVKAGLAL
jgi:hypothetical protein